MPVIAGIPAEFPDKLFLGKVQQPQPDPVVVPVSGGGAGNNQWDALSGALGAQAHRAGVARHAVVERLRPALAGRFRPTRL